MIQKELQQKLLEIRHALNNAQHITGTLASVRHVSAYDSRLAVFKAQEHMEESLKLLGFIEATEERLSK